MLQRQLLSASSAAELERQRLLNAKLQEQMKEKEQELLRVVERTRAEHVFEMDQLLGLFERTLKVDMLLLFLPYRQCPRCLQTKGRGFGLCAR